MFKLLYRDRKLPGIYYLRPDFKPIRRIACIRGSPAIRFTVKCLQVHLIDSLI